MKTAATGGRARQRGAPGVPETSGERVVVAIVTPLESELLEPIRAVAEGVELLYEPDLLPPVRYPGDHHGV